MAFFEALFPPRISRNAQGGPRFLTSKAYTVSGQRQTNRNATYPLHQYTIGHPVKTGADFEQLRAFFYVVGGDADAFRFKDWSDFRATQANTSTTVITGTTYQLNRTYTFGGRQFVRPIYKPVAGVQVFRTRGVDVTDITESCAVNTTNGQMTVNTGHQAGDTYTWVGTFHVPVAFKDPAALWRLLGTPNMLTEWPSIELEEIRP